MLYLTWSNFLAIVRLVVCVGGGSELGSEARGVFYAADNICSWSGVFLF